MMMGKKQASETLGLRPSPTCATAREQFKNQLYGTEPSRLTAIKLELPAFFPTTRPYLEATESSSPITTKLFKIHCKDILPLTPNSPKLFLPNRSSD
jgi:hypothetical protein